MNWRNSFHKNKHYIVVVLVTNLYLSARSSSFSLFRNTLQHEIRKWIDAWKTSWANLVLAKSCLDCWRVRVARFRLNLYARSLTQIPIWECFYRQCGSHQRMSRRWGPVSHRHGILQTQKWKAKTKYYLWASRQDTQSQSKLAKLGNKKGTRRLLGPFTYPFFRSLVRLLRTACFASALRCAHSFARSLTHSKAHEEE